MVKTTNQIKNDIPLSVPGLNLTTDTSQAQEPPSQHGVPPRATYDAGTAQWPGASCAGHGRRSERLAAATQIGTAGGIKHAAGGGFYGILPAK